MHNAPPRALYAHLQALQRISPAEYEMLQFLNKAIRPMTITEIAQTQGVHQNSVRENIESLYAVGLIGRRRIKTNTAGRPAWRYFSVAPKGEALLNIYASSLGAVLSEFLDQEFPNAQEIAYNLGKSWANELQGIIDAEIVKISGGVNPAELPDDEGIELARNMLSRFGHTATVKETDPDTLCINSCPFLENDGTVKPLICEIHRGQLCAIIQRLSEKRDRITLRPRLRPGVCELTIKTLPEQLRDTDLAETACCEKGEENIDGENAARSA